MLAEVENSAATGFVSALQGHFQLCYRAALYPRFYRLPDSSDYLITSERCRALVGGLLLSLAA